MTGKYILNCSLHLHCVSTGSASYADRELKVTVKKPITWKTYETRILLLHIVSALVSPKDERVHIGQVLVQHIRKATVH